MKSLLPLWHAASLAWVRFQQRTVDPMAPAALLLPMALRRADLERRP